MTQFDVYRNNNQFLREHVPFLVDVQSEVLSDLSTRVVVPLESLNDGAPALGRLNPTFEVEGRRVVLMPTEMAGVSTDRLGAAIGNLSPQRDTILRAIHFFLYGE